MLFRSRQAYVANREPHSITTSNCVSSQSNIPAKYFVITMQFNLFSVLYCKYYFAENMNQEGPTVLKEREKGFV